MCSHFHGQDQALFFLFSIYSKPSNNKHFSLKSSLLGIYRRDIGVLVLAAALNLNSVLFYFEVFTLDIDDIFWTLGIKSKGQCAKVHRSMIVFPRQVC